MVHWCCLLLLVLYLHQYTNTNTGGATCFPFLPLNHCSDGCACCRRRCMLLWQSQQPFTWLPTAVTAIAALLLRPPTSPPQRWLQLLPSPLHAAVPVTAIRSLRHLPQSPQQPAIVACLVLPPCFSFTQLSDGCCRCRHCCHWIHRNLFCSLHVHLPSSATAAAADATAASCCASYANMLPCTYHLPQSPQLPPALSLTQLSDGCCRCRHCCVLLCQ